MSNYIERIKKKTAQYCRHNIANIPVNRRYIAWKKELRITSFFQLPEAYQKEVKKFLRGTGKKEVRLVGSLASGAGIIPGITPPAFKELRDRVSGKARKNKSDIDLYVVGKDGHLVLKEHKSDVVNIHSLPMKFEPSVIIFKNGKYL